VQQFLLQTAVLRPLCASLCDAVMERDDSETLLEALAGRNLFIKPVGSPPAAAGERRWYCYHQLFAALLQGRLRQQWPERVAGLHRRAALWYAAQGVIESAIEHAFSAEDYALAADLLEGCAREEVMQGRSGAVGKWLRRLPEAERARLPRVNLALAWSLLLRGQYPALREHLRETAVLPDADPSLLAELHAISAALADSQGEAAAALDHAERALAYAAPDDLFAQAAAQMGLAGARREMGEVDAAISAYERAIPLCRAARLPIPEMLARAHLGFLYTLRGQLHRAAAAARPATEGGKIHPASGAARVALATVLLEWDELADAAQLLTQALGLAQMSGHNATAVNCHILFGRLYRAQGQYEAAQQSLTEAATLLALGAPAWLELLLLAQQVGLWLEMGEGGTAVAHLSHFTEPPAGHVREILPLTRARVCLHAGAAEALAEAASLLKGALKAATAEGHQGVVIEALLLRALLERGMGETAVAVKTMRRALKLAEPEGYVRLFTEAGAPCAALLAEVKTAYASRLLAAFPPDLRPAQPDALAELLTERELEVLAQMSRGLTYQQIAEELVVSVNTIRHHVKGVYGKLGVNGRLPAIEKARALQLLP
jgi:LuxR family transcriptional regulator, maltose regulon positive regulatory protein